MEYKSLNVVSLKAIKVLFINRLHVFALGFRTKLEELSIIMESYLSYKLRSVTLTYNVEQFVYVPKSPNGNSTSTNELLSNVVAI